MNEIEQLRNEIEQLRNELTLIRGYAAAHRTAAAKLAEDLADTREELADTRAELGRKSLARWAEECEKANARIDAEGDVYGDVIWDDDELEDD